MWCAAVCTRQPKEGVMVKVKAAVVSAAVAVALVAMPLSSASAHGRHHGVFFGLAAASAAVVVGAATLLTAPVAIVTAPFRAPYYPAPAYYPPPAPAYY